MGFEKQTERQKENVMLTANKTFIPENDVISENGYMTINEIVILLRKYKANPHVIQFIADMLEE